MTDRSRVSLATLRSAPTTATASSTTPSSAVLSSFSHTSCYNSDHRWLQQLQCVIAPAPQKIILQTFQIFHKAHYHMLLSTLRHLQKWKHNCKHSSSSRNEYYLGGIIALLLKNHHSMSSESVCSNQYMVTDQHWATGAQIKHSTLSDHIREWQPKHGYLRTVVSTGMITRWMRKEWQAHHQCKWEDANYMTGVTS